LPEHMVPSTFITLGRLPVGPNGKLDRAALPAPATPEQPVTLATTHIERTITAIWQEVLGLSAVGLDEPFFEVGGHSLALARVHALLHSRLRVEVDVLTLLGLPTIRQLATHVAGQPAAPGAPTTAALAKPAQAPTAQRAESVAIVGMAVRA